MDLMNIVNRDERLPVDQSEVLYVIQQYIKARKGIEVTPYINSNMGIINLQLEVSAMNQAFLIAQSWFKQNPIKK
jgi:septum formation topological specificity factor MinE